MAKHRVWLSTGMVAKYKDGRLSTGMAGQVQGLVANLVVHLLVKASSLASNPDIPQKSKIINGRHKQRNGQTHAKPPKFSSGVES